MTSALMEMHCSKNVWRALMMYWSDLETRIILQYFEYSLPENVAPVFQSLTARMEMTADFENQKRESTHAKYRFK